MNCQNTFIWKDLREWRFLVEAVIPLQERQDLVRAIEQSPERFKYIDDVTCFREVYSEFGDYSQIERRLPTHIRNTFTSVRMFHCCRAVSIQSYYEHGLQVLDSHQANDLFRKIFLGNPRLPEVTAGHIAAAIEEMTASNNGDRNGYVYFGLDDRFLIQQCPHYLMYGGEYLQTLTRSIEAQVGCAAMPELTRIGIPTVFVVDVPVQDFFDSDLTMLGKAALHAWAYSVAHKTEDVRKIDFGIGIKHCLGPEFIREHYSPETILELSRR